MIRRSCCALRSTEQPEKKRRKYETHGPHARGLHQTTTLASGNSKNELKKCEHAEKNNLPNKEELFIIIYSVLGLPGTAKSFTIRSTIQTILANQQSYLMANVGTAI